MGTSLMLTGDIPKGRAHYNQAFALYDPAKHRPLATRFGQDVGVSIFVYRALAHWMLGYPETALADADHALEDAREGGHAGRLRCMHSYTHRSPMSSAQNMQQQTHNPMKLSGWRTRRAQHYGRRWERWNKVAY